MSRQLLTPTDLAAREARADDALAHREQGETVWQPAQVDSLSQWVEQQWLRHWPAQQLMTRIPLLALWRAVIEADGRPLLSPQQCAQLALAADQLARRHRIDPQRSPAYTEEHQAFRRWAAEVSQQLQTLQAVTVADLPDRIDVAAIAHPVRLHGAWPARPPNEADLLRRLNLECAAIPAPPPPTAAWCYPDADRQYQGLAEQLRPRLAAAEDRPLRILLAVPDIDSARVALDDALGDALAPWRHRPGESGLLPWRWATPTALGDRAWARGWQQMAQLHRGPLDFAQLQGLLLNPAVWAGERRVAAAVLEATLRDRGWPRIDLADLATLAARVAPALSAPLQRLATQLGREPARALPGQWHLHFVERADALLDGTPMALDSTAFQIRRATTLASSRLGSLDRLLGRVSAATAAHWLGEWLSQPFQPRVEHPQPLLVGRPQDLIGIPCDLLVIADATSETLPGRASFNPFLAVEAQRATGVAEAHPQHWLNHQRRLLEGLRQGAAECWVTRPEVDARGAPTLPCPWLDLDWQAPPTPGLTPAPAPLDCPDIDPVPAVSAAEGIVADAGLFQRMLAAPLLALCVDRLGAHAMTAPPGGLPVWLQGTLIHAALADVWGRLQTRARLLGLDADACTDAATTAVDAQLPRLLPTARFGAVLVALERQRAIDLVRDWLRHEQRRDAPFTVIAREQLLEGQIDALPVRLRLDRADRVQTPGGDQVVLLDYKTGREANPRGWQADRMDAPQLPLYAVLAQRDPTLQPLGGIGFAHLKEGHPALSTQTCWTTRLIDGSDPKPDSDWPATLAGWQHTLENAARGFLAGHAGADPKVLTRGLAPYAALLDRPLDDDDDTEAPA